MIRYTIHLTKEEVDVLQGIINKGSHTTQTFRAAYILLNCDEGKYSQKVTNEQLAQVLRIGLRTIDRVKKRFMDEGLDVVLDRKPTTRVYDRKADGDLEAKIVSLCCSAPPEGYAKWTFAFISG